MADQETRTEAGLVAELNDLLQLDHDAVGAYTIAIDNLANAARQEVLRAFRGDHERHIEELTRLVREHGGVPVQLSHIPTGAFKLAIQKIGAAGGDRQILLAFKANERQVRDKYRRIADRPGHPEAVRAVLQRNAADEERHYEWAVGALRELGVGPESWTGRSEAAFEEVHSRAADAVEGAERKVMEGAERARRTTIELGGRAREAAGTGLESAAGAVDRAGTWAEEMGGAGARAGGMAHRLADRLEDAARYLREHDFSTMGGDLEHQLEEHPIRSVLLAAGMGYLLGRLLR